MNYRVSAYKCKVNSIISLEDNIVPVGSVYEQGDLFIMCLEPLEERHLPEEDEESASNEESADSG